MGRVNVPKNTRPRPRPGTGASGETSERDETVAKTTKKHRRSVKKNSLSLIQKFMPRSRAGNPARDSPNGTTRRSPPESKASTKVDLPNNFVTALQVAKDLGEIVENFPYVKAIAGLCLTLIKMWEDVQRADANAAELIQRVSDRLVDLHKMLNGLLTDGSRRIKDLVNDLKEYERLLKNISATLVKYQNLGFPQRMVNRHPVHDTIDKLVRDMEDYDRRFTIKWLFEILTALEDNPRQNGAVLPVHTGDVMFQECFPTAPIHFLGRQSEKSDIIALLLSRPNPHVVILGTGGMGKTTLARAVIHDPAILATFEIFFVSCERATTIDSILISLADVLAIPPLERHLMLQRNVMARLRSSPTLLCLDNFEDPWDPPDTRSQMEAFLNHLNGMPQLGLLLTMRGTERPNQVEWTRPPPSPLSTLPVESALELFYRISGLSADDRIPKLLEQVDHIPLVIELLAQQINPPNDDLDNVLGRWAKHGLCIFDRKDQSDQRLTSVTKSISLSLQSPRIRDVPDIHDALRLLSAVPDGLAESTVPLLQTRLPSTFNLDDCLRKLAQISLCYLDGGRRYRLHGLIRQHVQVTITLQSTHRDAVAATYLDYVIQDGVTQEAVAAELVNIRAFITASDVGSWDDELVHACLSFLRWEQYLLGIRDVRLASKALEHAKAPELRAQCYLRLSQIAHFSNQYEQAERYLRPALSLVTGSRYWEGRVQLAMGNILFYRHRYEEAESCLRKAVNLFRLEDENVWEGRSLEILGSLLRHWGHLSEAESVLKQSLELARSARLVVQEGNAAMELGELYRAMDRMPEVETFVRLGIDCSRRANATKNEGIACCYLGNILRSGDKFDEAKESYLLARGLAQRIHAADDEASALQGLGRVCAHMEGQSGRALGYFQQALVLYRPIQASLEQAITHKHLGLTLLRLERNTDALAHFCVAFAFHQRRLHHSHRKHIPSVLKLVLQAMK